MKLDYHPETDSLYIDLSERESVESREISEGVVLDYDAEGKLVGIDIDNAGNKVELKRLILSSFPVRLRRRLHNNAAEATQENMGEHSGRKWPRASRPR